MDPHPGIRHRLVRLIVDNQPFKRAHNHRLDTPELVERIWNLINCNLSHDTKLRCDLVDLYYALYGTKRPLCLPKIDDYDDNIEKRPPSIATIGRIKKITQQDTQDKDESKKLNKTIDNNNIIGGGGVNNNNNDDIVELDGTDGCNNAKRKATSPIILQSQPGPSSANDNNLPPTKKQKISNPPDEQRGQQSTTADGKVKSEYYSDNSASLPGLMGIPGPVGFEPGMFKKEIDDNKIKGESSKGKKKKKDKKKHKHKHKHKHDHKHGKDKDKKDKDKKDKINKDKIDPTIANVKIKDEIKEETLSSVSSSPSPEPSSSNGYSFP